MKSVLLLANPSLRVANPLLRVSLTDAPPKYWNVPKEPASPSMKMDVNCASAQVSASVCKFTMKTSFVVIIQCNKKICNQQLFLEFRLRF